MDGDQPQDSPAAACLRVVIDRTISTQSARALDALLERLLNAFLETHWAWPRQFKRAAPNTFILVDSRTTELDQDEIKELARNLQLRLFGSDATAGKVCLLLFQGGEHEVLQFATLAPDDLQAIKDGAPGAPALSSALTAISAQDIKPIAAPNASAPTPPTAVSAPPLEPTVLKLRPQFRALYSTGRETFIGDALFRRFAGPDTADALEGGLTSNYAAILEHDSGCIDWAVTLLESGAVRGLLLVPISFSALARKAGRETYATLLNALPVAQRARLGAAIYDTPREPSFQALAQLHAVLDPHFSHINLRTPDPNFAIDKLAPKSVQSVDLILTGQDEAGRLAAIRHFSKYLDTYRRREVIPAVSNLRSRAELSLCLSFGIPFASGPIVSDPLGTPLGGRPFPVDNLPVRAIAA